MLMNFMVYVIGMLGFWICGFAIMFGRCRPGGDLGMLANLGNVFTIIPVRQDFGIMGYKGFFLTGGAYDVSIFTLFLFRWFLWTPRRPSPPAPWLSAGNFRPFCVYGFFISMLIYPLYGNWVWGGGWLSTLGANFGLGHGAVDFAGSGVVHMVGGVYRPGRGVRPGTQDRQI